MEVRANMKIIKILPVIGLLCLFTATASFAGHPEIPRISIDELKQLIDTNADIVIVDAQVKEIYYEGHITGAVSLPWKPEVTEDDVANLPTDKLIITYCACGPGEADSADLANQLINLGFENVKVLAHPAIEGWMQAGYPTEKK